MEDGRETRFWACPARPRPPSAPSGVFICNTPPRRDRRLLASDESSLSQPAGQAGAGARQQDRARCRDGSRADDVYRIEIRDIGNQHLIHPGIEVNRPDATGQVARTVIERVAGRIEVQAVHRLVGVPWAANLFRGQVESPNAAGTCELEIAINFVYGHGLNRGVRAKRLRQRRAVRLHFPQLVIVH